MRKIFKEIKMFLLMLVLILIMVVSLILIQWKATKDIWSVFKGYWKMTVGNFLWRLKMKKAKKKMKLIHIDIDGVLSEHESAWNI